MGMGEGGKKMKKFSIFVVIIIFIFIFGRSTQATTCLRDVPYKSQVWVKPDFSEKKFLGVDIYLPPNFSFFSDDHYPVVIYLHSGGGFMGSKELFLFPAEKKAVEYLVEKGYIVLCPDYSLNLRAGVTALNAIQDIRDLISWMVTRPLAMFASPAEDFNMDISRLSVVGTSYGAYLALMITQEETAVPVTRLVLNSGIYDLRQFSLEETGFPEQIALMIANMVGYHCTPDYWVQVRERVGIFISEEENFILQNWENPLFVEKRGRFSPKFSPKMTAKTVIVHGEEDNIIPFSQALLGVGGLDGATLISFKGGHGLNFPVFREVWEAL